MISAEKSVGDPVFVPPRKRQTTKKTNGVQNYVDHIVTQAQVLTLFTYYFQLL